MKRIGGLYEKIISPENLRMAESIARKGKSKQYGVRQFGRDPEGHLSALHDLLQARQFRTSQYTIFKVFEPKEREVYRLPYFPDRIVHHAIMNVLEPIFVSVFTADSYSCVKGKGIHGAANAVKHSLRDWTSTQYCLKLDIRKFYPSISHSVLKHLLRRKFKDQDLLNLLDEIIDSAPGLPIGNYLSQYFANFYLTYFDHWIKEVKGIRYYIRYADDLVILAPDKASLHQLLSEICEYLSTKLRLQIKDNYQIFPVEARGIDFVGYVFRHIHIRLRKSIKKNFARSLAKHPNLQSVASYNGWIAHCNGRHLLKKLLHETVQRTGNQSFIPRFYRRQNKDRPIAQQRDHSPGLQDRAIDSETRNRLSDLTIRAQRREACNIHQRNEID